MKTTIKEAFKTKIFTIVDGEVVEDNLCDFVMESAEETTTPNGVEMKLHVREVSNVRYEVWKWGPSGYGSRFIEAFETEEAAEDDIFERTYNSDFMEDDQRDTSFYSTYEEALEPLAENFAYDNDIDVKVAKSILHHQDCARQIAKKYENK